jgi:small GTP-binding protein
MIYLVGLSEKQFPMESADPPVELCCPITKHLMKDPVVMPDGHTYERSALLQWLHRSPVSPITRQSMSIDDARPNYALKGMIDRYRRDHPGQSPPPAAPSVSTPAPPSVSTPRRCSALPRAAAGMRHKVVLLGNTRTGKTSILARMLGEEVPMRSVPTIATTFHRLDIQSDDKRPEVLLSIWDTAGQEVYHSLVPMYARGAEAALLVCDITDRESFECLESWANMAVDAAGRGICLFVVANKIDLRAQQVVGDEALLSFAARRQAALLEVSALTGEGISDLLETIAHAVSTTGSMVTHIVHERRAVRCC